MEYYNLVTMSKTRFFKLDKLPLVLEQNAFYYIFGQEFIECYITDNKGKAKPYGSTAMIEYVVNNMNITGGTNPNTVIDYRSDYNALYIYSGFLLNTVPVIKRCKNGIEEIAQGVNNLEVDWLNRLTLTYA